ncbi:type 2 periplasmic-binding domain-containing protein [Paraburkholderia sp. RL17-373-BIF-A]|jgi:hypothetical protein|uniref:hypothetical protein n=1 Tax=Paraburkholderia sp. RL17-373-BIF-A TaxID=3031629 RepID=UPI0038BBFDE8
MGFVAVPRHYVLAMLSREPLRHLVMPYDLPCYTVKQHRHARFHRDPGNVWLRQTIADPMPSAVMNHPYDRPPETNLICDFEAFFKLLKSRSLSGANRGRDL